LNFEAFQLMTMTDQSQDKLCQLYFLFIYTANTKSKGLLVYPIFNPNLFKHQKAEPKAISGIDISPGQ